MKTASGAQREGEEEEGDAEETVEGGRGGREGETEAEAETEREDETRGSVGFAVMWMNLKSPSFSLCSGITSTLSHRSQTCREKSSPRYRCEKKAGWPLRLWMERMELLKTTLL